MLSVVPMYYAVGPVMSADGTLIFGTADTLYAVSNYGTGSQVWQLPRDIHRYVTSTPPTLAADGTLYVPAEPAHLFAVNTLVNPPTMKWAAPFYLGDQLAIMSSPAIGADGTIYFIGGDDDGPHGWLVALEPIGGTQLWRLTGVGCEQCSVAIGLDGNLYTSSYSDSSLYAVFPNGTTYWKYFTSAGTTCPIAPSVAPDGTVYHACRDGYVYALFPNGTLRWKTQIGAAGVALQTIPAIGFDGTLYVGNANDQHMYALYPKTRTAHRGGVSPRAAGWAPGPSWRLTGACTSAATTATTTR